jgi:hypothetical protein
MRCGQVREAKHKRQETTNKWPQRCVASRENRRMKNSQRHLVKELKGKCKKRGIPGSKDPNTMIRRLQGDDYINQLPDFVSSSSSTDADTSDGESMLHNCLRHYCCSKAIEMV